MDCFSSFCLFFRCKQLISEVRLQLWSPLCRSPWYRLCLHQWFCSRLWPLFDFFEQLVSIQLSEPADPSVRSASELGRSARCCCLWMEASAAGAPGMSAQRHPCSVKTRRWGGLRQQWKLLGLFEIDQNHEFYGLTCMMKEGLAAAIQNTSSYPPMVSTLQMFNSSRWLIIQSVEIILFKI